MSNDQYERMLVNSPKFLAVLAEGQRQISAGEYSTHEEFWKKRKAKKLQTRQANKKKTATRR